jgi:hypothetical protein
MTPAEDAKRFLDGYPDLEIDTVSFDNVRFYKGEIKSRSIGGKGIEDFIDNVQGILWEDYELMESQDSWWEWLFPIREANWRGGSQSLTPRERDEILKDPQCIERMVRSYMLAIDLFGFVLTDTESGILQRKPDFQQRFAALNGNHKHFDQITRLVKWLGEFSLGQYQVPLVSALTRAVYEPPFLVWDMRISLDGYFARVVRDDNERERLSAVLKHLDAAASLAWRKGSGERELIKLRVALQTLGVHGIVPPSAGEKDEPPEKRSRRD